MSAPKCIDGLRLLLLLVVAAFVLSYALLITSIHQVNWLIRNLGYGLILFSSALFAYCCWKVFNSVLSFSGLKDYLKKERLPLLLMLLLTGLMHLHESHQLKTMYDEYTFVGYSQQMHRAREVSMPGSAHYVDNQFYVVKTLSDKRPFFYAFLISLAHDLTGYRVSNGIWVNALLTPILLLLLYHLLKPYIGVWPALTSLSMLAGVPVLMQASAGGGYDLLNLVMILAFILTGQRYVKEESDDDGAALGLWVMTGVLLAQVRCESVLFLLALPLGFIWKSLNKRDFRFPLWLCVTPIFVLPSLLAYRVFKSHPDYADGLDRGYLSLGHLPDNLGHALYYLFSFDERFSSSPWIAMLGILAVLFWLVNFLKGKGWHVLGKISSFPLSSGVLLMVVMTLLGLLNHWGQWDDPLAGRFSLPFYLLLAMSIGAFVALVSKEKPRWAKCFFFLGMGQMILYGNSIAAKGMYNREIVVASETQWLLKEVDQFEKEEILVINSSSLPFIVRNYASLPSSVAERRYKQLAFCFYNKIYEHILVAKRSVKPNLAGCVDVNTGWSDEAPFILKEIASKSFREGITSGLYEIVGLRDDCPVPECLDDKVYQSREDYALEILNQLP